MLSTIAHASRVTRAAFAVGPYWAPAFVKRGVPLHATSSCGGIKLSPFGCTLQRKVDDWLVDSYWNAVELEQTVAARFERQADGAIRIHTPHFTIDAAQPDDLWTLLEVLRDRLYGFRLREKCVVVDIGCNIGITPLYFASVGCPVIGYEAVPSTFRKAVHNVALNPELRDLIQIRPNGVGGTSRSATIRSHKTRSNLSTLFKDSDVTIAPQDAIDIEIELTSIDDVLQDACVRFPGHSIVLKVDCEGAEYEIVDKLQHCSALHRVAMVMMEWHRFAPEHDPGALLSTLGELGFASTIHGNSNACSGMLYSVRRMPVTV